MVKYTTLVYNRVNSMIPYIIYTLHYADPKDDASQPGFIEYVVTIHNSFVAIALTPAPCASSICAIYATQVA